jgi:hypothetical protein
MDEIGKLEKCVQDLHLTNPRDDKKRIEDTKGSLLEDSYRWILENSDFQRWRNDQQSRLLWIKGDPGKGKTMLLCGIINELEKSMSKIDILSYFFCQATDSRINHATAAHYALFSRSLQVMSRTLRRDIYNLGSLGYPAKQVTQPNPDPLAASRYSCIYWVDHLCDWNSNASIDHSVDLQAGGPVDNFIRKKYLYWLEALSLCKSMSEGLVSVAKLKALIQVTLKLLILSNNVC